MLSSTQSCPDLSFWRAYHLRDTRNLHLTLPASRFIALTPGQLFQGRILFSWKFLHIFSLGMKLFLGIKTIWATK